MIILGIYGSFGWEANESYNKFSGLETDDPWVHDSGATLFINGKHICSISEERLTRVKREGNFPTNSINYCLSEGNISAEDVEYVYIPTMANFLFYKKLYGNAVTDIAEKNFPNAKIEFLSHHVSHAFSSIFTSNFNEGCLITTDGGGSIVSFSDSQPPPDNVIDLDYYAEQYSPFIETSTIGYFNKEKKIFRLFPNIKGANNFGAFYSGTSYAIYCQKTKSHLEEGNKNHRDSFVGKIMGLSAYGKNFKFSERHKLYTTHKDVHYNGMPFVKLKINSGGLEKNMHPNAQAYVVQKNFELAMMEYIESLHKDNYLEKNICLSGGVYLNVLTNSLIKESGLFDNIHIPPYTDDSGLHFGAACYGLFKNNQSITVPENIALLGKEYTNDEIEFELKQNKLNYEKYDNFEELCELTAKKLNDGSIVAWFQGRSEHGPRALGSRSILMHPGPRKNKDIMNERVKHREYWRPFAGIILEEHLTDYFNEDYNSPYMLYSLTVKDEMKQEIAAITHVDGTCRIQTVNKKLNEKVTTLLNKFKKESGVPAVLNTSFNDNGEPIVESPKDAVSSFLKMDIDYLVIGNFIVSK